MCVYVCVCVYICMYVYIYIYVCVCMYVCVCVYVHVCFTECSDILLQYNYGTVFPSFYATLKLGLTAQALFSSPHTHTKHSKYLACCSLISIALFHCQFIRPWMNVDAADYFEKVVTTYIVYTVYISDVVYAAYITYSLRNLPSVHNLHNLHNLRSLHNLQSTQST
jgi:hypothetical protein